MTELHTVQTNLCQVAGNDKNNHELCANNKSFLLFTTNWSHIYMSYANTMPQFQCHICPIYMKHALINADLVNSEIIKVKHSAYHSRSKKYLSKINIAEAPFSKVAVNNK